MSEIAAHCHTSKSVFYRYFTDKDGLRQELGNYVVARMERRMTEAVAEAGSFEESIRALVRQYFWQIQNSPEVYLFVVSESTSSEDSPVDRFCQAVTELVANTHKNHSPGEQRIPESIARYWAAGVVGLVRGAGEAWMLPRAASRAHHTQLTERPGLEEFVQLVTLWVLNGPQPSQNL